MILCINVHVLCDTLNYQSKKMYKYKNAENKYINSLISGTVKIYIVFLEFILCAPSSDIRIGISML